MNGEKCELLSIHEWEDSKDYEIHANIDWDINAFRDDTNSYKEAIKEVIKFFNNIYHFDTEDYRVMVSIINNNKDYHYNRIALWFSSPIRFYDAPYISWFSNSLSSSKDEIWSP